MIDPIVAIEKLSAFETSDEIAAFLDSQGAQGAIGLADRCVISNWLQSVTGDPLINTSVSAIWTLSGGADGQTFAQPPAPVIQEFIQLFDYGKYPTLVTEWDCFRENETAYEADDDLYKCED